LAPQPRPLVGLAAERQDRCAGGGILHIWYRYTNLIMKLPESTTEETSFSTVLRQASPERAAHLHRPFAGNAELQQRNDQLLQVQPQVGDFIEDRPAATEAGSREASRIASGQAADPGTRIGRCKLLPKLGVSEATARARLDGFEDVASPGVPGCRRTREGRKGFTAV